MLKASDEYCALGIWCPQIAYGLPTGSLKPLATNVRSFSSPFFSSSCKIAKAVFATLLTDGGDPAAIIEARGLSQVTDRGELTAIVARLITTYRAL